MGTKNPLSTKTYLDHLVSRYHLTEYLVSDPLQFLHTPGLTEAEQEVIAPLAALFAYGRVAQIQKNVETAIRGLTKHSNIVDATYEWTEVDTLEKLRKKSYKTWGEWKHRFHSSEDLGFLLFCIAHSLKKYGSIGAHFLSHHQGETIENGVEQLAGDWLQWAASLYRVESVEALPQKMRFLFSRPSSGSVCKRWMMWLRWMGRSDELDPGLWTPGRDLVKLSKKKLYPYQLLLPLDTHVARIGSFLGLVSPSSIRWKSVLETSFKLRQLDPVDPIRYDFSIARLGILSECKKKYVPSICGRCSLFGGCRLVKASYKNLGKNAEQNLGTL